MFLLIALCSFSLLTTAAPIYSFGEGKHYEGQLAGIANMVLRESNFTGPVRGPEAKEIKEWFGEGENFNTFMTMFFEKSFLEIPEFKKDLMAEMDLRGPHGPLDTPADFYSSLYPVNPFLP